MEFTGKFEDLKKDWQSGKWIISFSVNEESVLQAGIDAIKDLSKLAIKVIPFRKKRSLDANAYFHVLVGKLADKLKISKVRCKNLMITQYGQLSFKNDSIELKYSEADPEEMLEYTLEHVLYDHEVEILRDNEIVGVLNAYRVYRGSHTYNSAEMSILIDGTIAECKEQGIETMPPAELERMIQKWQPKKE